MHVAHYSWEIFDAEIHHFFIFKIYLYVFGLSHSNEMRPINSAVVVHCMPVCLLIEQHQADISESGQKHFTGKSKLNLLAAVLVCFVQLLQSSIYRVLSHCIGICKCNARILGVSF